MNPPSTHHAPAADQIPAPRTRVRRVWLARVAPLVSCLLACLLLGAAAAADGHATAFVLAVWMGLLVLVGMRLTSNRPDRQVRPPELVLATMGGDGEFGEARVHALVPTRAAIAVLRSRPRG
jgi:hypothetical protein